MERRLKQSQDDITEIYRMLEGIDKTLARHGRHLGQIDKDLNRMETRFIGRMDTMGARLDTMETTIDDMDKRFSTRLDTMDARLDTMDASLAEVLTILRASQPNQPN